MNPRDLLKRFPLMQAGACVAPGCDEPGQYEGPNDELLCAHHAMSVARAILGGINRKERRACAHASKRRGRGLTKSTKSNRKRRKR